MFLVIALYSVLVVSLASKYNCRTPLVTLFLRNLLILFTLMYGVLPPLFQKVVTSIMCFSLMISLVTLGYTSCHLEVKCSRFISPLLPWCTHSMVLRFALFVL